MALSDPSLRSPSPPAPAAGPENPASPRRSDWAGIDTAAVARALSQIAEGEEDLADAFFERLETVTLATDGHGPRWRVRREEGLAIRLLRFEGVAGEGAAAAGRAEPRPGAGEADGASVPARSWLASRDALDGAAFGEALRQVARVLPTAAYPEPRIELEPWPSSGAARGGRGAGVPDPEMAELPGRIERAIRERRAAFPLSLSVERHRRRLLVVGPRFAAPGQRESFYSLAAELPQGRWGTLLPRLDEAAVETVAEALVGLFRARDAAPPEAAVTRVVLAPAAAAVFLHEAVAHALEADTLAEGGDPAKAVGVELGSPLLDVLDDPGTAPPEVRRRADDEGVAVVRRWLLRRGRVVEPLADSRWAARSAVLAPGAGRRADRHLPPGPRSTHLELAPGASGEAELLAAADGGLWLPAASRGSLAPHSGRFRLAFPWARRIRSGRLAEPVGPCHLEGRVADLLARVIAVGSEPRPAGAGWCAKGGQRLPVWATAPPLALEGVRVRP